MRAALSRYSTIAQQTASPDRLMVMLFEAACRHMESAAAQLDALDRKGAAVGIRKTQDIVQELLGTLNPAVQPELCAQLADVYAFTLARLVKAQVSGEAQAVRDAHKVFAPVAQAFAQVVAHQEDSGRAA